MEIKQRGMARWRLCTVNDSHKQKEDDWHKDDCIQPTTNTKKRRQLAKRCMCTVDNSHNQRDVDWHNDACFQPTTHTNKKKTTSSMTLMYTFDCTDCTLLTVETHTNKQTNSRHLRHRKRRRLGEWRAIGLYTFTKWRLHPVNNNQTADTYKEEKDD